ncbi:hypothetical protein SEA_REDWATTLEHOG_148 [Gordonia phage RedWattleHog]|nr:hypothetical protein SEA_REDWATTLEHOG_148 [Gordonia phage RedWattleHog]
MDPDQLLEAIQRNATQLTERHSAEQAETLAQDILALDEWLSKGGFLPKEWARNR